MTDDNSCKDEFLHAVRAALGHASGAGLPTIPDVTAFSRDSTSVAERARSVRTDAEARADELFSELESSASEAGWKVERLDSPAQAARYIESLAHDLGAQLIIRSAHAVLDRLQLEQLLADTGIELRVMAIDEGTRESETARQRLYLREKAIRADMGVTGVDYAIAETGSCVLLARKGVSRLVSLLPPAHVAVVVRGQVLPSLDELFALRRQDFLAGNAGRYMNIISGPSSSADIEQTIVTGVHGPGDVHMVLLG